MARFGGKPNKDLEEIADLIIAEWFRVVPENPGEDVLEMDINALTAALNNLLDLPCRAVADEENLVHVIIPYPPAKTRAELEDYLTKNGQFKKKMTEATLFGCGR
jgi:hypothetical protein